ncbi:hypothetical protein Q8A67_018659 [Cirrhinus molitorella]|uniref:Uncharacterized protein n=1 Tax=Cirrhinus molitorella TaxID=172907 RepID=A0AA88PGQ7_9TELE|nr:hypothetical protein Q8A67_018659 [Cirrhinus molitorella]
MKSRKSKKPTRPTITPTFENPSQTQLPPTIPFLPGPSSNMRPSRRMKGRQKNIVFPAIGNAVNSVTRGSGTGNPLPSVPGIPAAPKGDQHGKTMCSDAGTFLSATDRARLFGINKWY